MLATSDEAIRERTGRGWEVWFDALDAWGAAERPHREIARWVAAELAIEPREAGGVSTGIGGWARDRACERTLSPSWTAAPGETHRPPG